MFKTHNIADSYRNLNSSIQRLGCRRLPFLARTFEIGDGRPKTFIGRFVMNRRRSPMMTQLRTISDHGPSSMDSVLRPSRLSHNHNIFHSARGLMARGGMSLSSDPPLLVNPVTVNKTINDFTTGGQHTFFSLTATRPTVSCT